MDRAADNPAAEEPELVVSNEFATVIVRRVHTRNGTRLEIDSPATGRSVRLDALVLESLTWADVDTLGLALRDPFGPPPTESPSPTPGPVTE
jgi:hypothetical protein